MPRLASPSLRAARARRQTAGAWRRRDGQPPRRRRASPPGQHPAWPRPPDCILVRGLRARAVIGDNAEERRAAQELVVGLRLAYRGRAGRTDRLADALDYRAVKKAVLRHVEASRHRLLEALAESIAQVCLAEPRVLEVAVTVDKPGALRFADSVAVRIVRRRGA